MKIAISPCPNDTFLYEAFVHEELARGSELALLDIAELNAFSSEADAPDLIKVSCAAAPRFLDRYALLPAGGAFSDAVGPLIVRSARSHPDDPIRSAGLPGAGTSAHILWRSWLADRGTAVPEESFHRFDLLPTLAAQGKVDASVVIHESRFTFREAGLEEVDDLGRHWDRTCGLPVPLGCLLARRSLGSPRIIELLERVRDSLRTAWSRPEPTTPWIRENAQEMEPDIQRRHIETYVTARSLDCGEAGLQALERLWTLADQHLGGCGAPIERRLEALQEARRLLLPAC